MLKTMLLSALVVLYSPSVFALGSSYNDSVSRASGLYGSAMMINVADQSSNSEQCNPAEDTDCQQGTEDESGSTVETNNGGHGTADTAMKHAVVMIVGVAIVAELLASSSLEIQVVVGLVGLSILLNS